MPRLYLSLLAVVSSSQLYAQAMTCDESEQALLGWREIAESHEPPSLDYDALAPQLAACLGAENPVLRDSYGYGLIAGWLRADLLSDKSRRDLTERLSANLGADETLLRSFSALVLAELLRADDLAPVLSDAERLALLRRSKAALEREADFRGLTEELGWVHPTAHLADVLWRFALHEQSGPETARIILQAVRDKAGESRAGFVANEGDRLARAASIVIRRGQLSDDEVIAWLQSFAEPSPAGAGLDAWPEAFTSAAGMNELHNSKLVFRALAASLRNRELQPSIIDRLNQLEQLFSRLV